jgi:hypothetical protein
MKMSPWYYVAPWSIEISNLWPLPHDDEKRYPAIRQHIKQLIPDQKNKGLIVSILENIFPDVKNAFLSEGQSPIDYGGMEKDYRIKKKRLLIQIVS